MYRLLIFAILYPIWLVLSGHFDPLHLVLGALCVGIVIWMSSDLWFMDRSRGAARRVREISCLVGYLIWLLWQVVLANLYILKLALSPGGLAEVAPQVVRFKTRLRSDFAKYVLAQSITLTPGTVTVKIVGDEFFVHAISKTVADGLDRSMESRIARVYEPVSEKA